MRRYLFCSFIILSLIKSLVLNFILNINFNDALLLWLCSGYAYCRKQLSSLVADTRLDTAPDITRRPTVAMGRARCETEHGTSFSKSFKAFIQFMISYYFLGVSTIHQKPGHFQYYWVLPHPQCIPGGSSPHHLGQQESKQLVLSCETLKLN